MNATSYQKSVVRFATYIAIRYLQALVGITGNIFTLVIIYRIKQRTNLHIIMIYLALSDIAVPCLVPLTTYIFANEINLIHDEDWDTMCVVKEVVLWIAYLGCCLSYVFLSVDR